MTPDEIDAAIRELMALKPLSLAQQTKAKLSAAGLTSELKAQRRTLADTVRKSRGRALKLQGAIADMLRARGNAHWRADDWKARGPGANEPRRYAWQWYEAGVGNDEKLRAARESLTSATETFRSAQINLQLFDACHGVATVEYVDLPELDQEGIEAAAYAAAPASWAEAMAHLKARQSAPRKPPSDNPLFARMPRQ